MDDQQQHMANSTEIHPIFCRIKSLLEDKLDVFNLEEVTLLLKRVTELLKDFLIREQIQFDHIESLTTILTHCTALLNGDRDGTGYITEDVKNCTTEIYRCLRNSCVSCRENQDLITRHPACLQCVKIIINALTNQGRSNKPEYEQNVVLLRCAVQFLGNYVSGHFDNGKDVWKLFADCFCMLLRYGDTKLTEYTCMVVHSAISGPLCDNGWRQQLMLNTDFLDVVENVVKAIAHHDFDWGIFVIEDALQIDDVFEAMMDRLKSTDRTLLLEILLSQLKNVCNDEMEPMVGVPCLDTLLYISNKVVENSYNVLILASQDTDIPINLEPEVIIKLIEILGLATSSHNLYPELQDESDLLTCVVYLLDGVHKLGQLGSKVYSPVTKLGDNSADKNHPVFGLRNDLIRLIGNMCYKHRGNQDRVRNLNGIPLILDQTQIDKRNPFISQWSILAIRNLMEDNQENKNILEGLKQQGLADNADVLKELGLDAEMRDEKIYVKPKPEQEMGTEVKAENTIVPLGYTRPSTAAARIREGKHSSGHSQEMQNSMENYARPASVGAEFQEEKRLVRKPVTKKPEYNASSQQKNVNTSQHDAAINKRQKDGDIIRSASVGSTYKDENIPRKSKGDKQNELQFRSASVGVDYNSQKVRSSLPFSDNENDKQQAKVSGGWVENENKKLPVRPATAGTRPQGNSVYARPPHADTLRRGDGEIKETNMPYVKPPLMGIPVRENKPFARPASAGGAIPRKLNAKPSHKHDNSN